MRIDDRVSVGLGDVVNEMMQATRGCPSMREKLKTDASLAPIRGALAKTLALSIATGAVKNDGAGLQAALERGVVLYARAGSDITHKLVFTKGEVAIQEPDGATGIEDQWKPATKKPYTVKGRILTVGTDRLELTVDGPNPEDVSLARFKRPADATESGPYNELYDDNNLCISKGTATR